MLSSDHSTSVAQFSIGQHGVRRAQGSHSRVARPLLAQEKASNICSLKEIQQNANARPSPPFGMAEVHLTLHFGPCFCTKKVKLHQNGAHKFFCSSSLVVGSIKNNNFFWESISTAKVPTLVFDLILLQLPWFKSEVLCEICTALVITPQKCWSLAASHSQLEVKWWWFLFFLRI